jgi:hypothetical protein
MIETGRGCAVDDCKLPSGGAFNGVPLCVGHSAAVRGRLVKMGMQPVDFNGDVLQLLAAPATPDTEPDRMAELRARWLQLTKASLPSPFTPAVSVLVLCECRHSPAAHARSQGQSCTFCSCREFRAWVEPVPTVHDALPRDVVAALTTLAKEPAFNELALEHLAALGRSGRRRFFSRGMILADVGDQSQALYLVLSGAIEADRRAGTHGAERVAELGPGELVGAVGVLRGGERGVTIRAAEDLVVLELPAKDLKDIFRQDKTLYRAFLRMVYSRLSTVAGH